MLRTKANEPGVIVNDFSSGFENVVERMQRVDESDLFRVFLISLRQVQIEVIVDKTENLLNNKKVHFGMKIKIITKGLPDLNFNHRSPLTTG